MDIGPAIAQNDEPIGGQGIVAADVSPSLVSGVVGPAIQFHPEAELPVQVVQVMDQARADYQDLALGCRQTVRALDVTDPAILQQTSPRPRCRTGRNQAQRASEPCLATAERHGATVVS